MRKLKIADRSAPITVAPDGKATWADKQYDSFDQAQDARALFRVLSWGMVYGGTGHTTREFTW